jgi:hypothetical protein
VKCALNFLREVVKYSIGELLVVRCNGRAFAAELRPLRSPHVDLGLILKRSSRRTSRGKVASKLRRDPRYGPRQAFTRGEVGWPKGAIEAWGFPAENAGEISNPPIKSAAPVKALATVCI